MRRADRILVLHGGRIVEAGTHSELLAREGGRYRALVEQEPGGPPAARAAAGGGAA